MILELAELQETEIDSHHLSGLVYSKFKLIKYKAIWKKQLIQNKLFFKELKILTSIFEKEGIKISVLKGFSLLDDIYTDWGARSTSDIDILIEQNNFSEAKKIIQNNGYREINEYKWKGNCFKVLFEKKISLLTVTIELHHQLFWHNKFINSNPRKSTSKIEATFLSLEDQLIHLCGHLAFQHNYLKLFWLFDIKYFVEKYQNQISWDLFWKRAEENKLIVSCQLTLSLISKKNYKYSSLKLVLLTRLCDKNYLLNPRNYFIKYYLIKFLLKDNLIDNFIYIFNYPIKKKITSQSSLID